MTPRSAGALCGVMLSCVAACADQGRNTGSIGFQSGDVPAGVEHGVAVSCAEGEVRCCYITLGEHSGVRSCYRGTQTCSGGVYGPCGDGTVSVRSGSLTQSAAPAAPGLDTVALSAPTDCVNNPCDPACQQFEETPETAITPPKVVVSSFPGGSVENLPGGFQSKGLKDSAHPPSDACTESADCQFDYRCDVPTGLCVPWAQGAVDPSCGGVDLTLGPTCNGIVPVCNRGNTTAPAGIEIIVYSGNQSQMQNNLGKCSGYAGSFASRCSTAVPIPPGHCVAVTDCNLNGTESIVVNPPSPPALAAPIEECDCGNNWTAYHNGGACSTQQILATAPLEVRQTYESQCPPSAAVQWGFLTWQAQAPSDASGSARILIQARTAPTAASFDDACSDCIIIADVPTDAPAVCSVGPEPCPIDLFDALGGNPAAMNPALQLVFTLDPSPDSAVTPKLLSWELTYSCPEVE